MKEFLKKNYRLDYLGLLTEFLKRVVRRIV